MKKNIFELIFYGLFLGIGCYLVVASEPLKWLVSVVGVLVGLSCLYRLIWIFKGD